MGKNFSNLSYARDARAADTRTPCFVHASNVTNLLLIFNHLPPPTRHILLYASSARSAPRPPLFDFHEINLITLKVEV